MEIIKQILYLLTNCFLSNIENVQVNYQTYIHFKRYPQFLY